jgi:hypothetical protein
VRHILLKKNKEHLNVDGGGGVGLNRILELKKIITSRNTDKVTNNHSVEAGIDEFDQKR